MRTSLLALPLLLAACTPAGSPAVDKALPQKPVAPAPVAAAPAPAPAGAATAYGAPIEGKQALPLGEVLSRPDDFAGKPILVDGKVRANCTAKGCWMELAADMDKAAPGCRVTFKDYGFFVPVNSRGSSARVEGELAVKTIPAAEVAHLEGEGGHFPAKLADGSAREVRIVARGVQLTRAN